MGKGNMFQGMTRGKVGDVVFSRLNGEQISRVRNRHPRNPRTNKQLIQRAIMATVLRAYSEGREILDHAFQGYSVGLNNQRRFLSVNMKELRSALAAAFNGETVGNPDTFVVGPSTLTPVPNKYLISEGHYDQNFFTITEVDAENTRAYLQTPAANEGETVGQYMQRTGLIVGDIYTIVGFAAGVNLPPVFTVEGTNSVGGRQMNGKFFFIRMIVNEPANPEAMITDTLFNQMFTITETRNIETFELADQGLQNANRLIINAIEIIGGDYDVASVGIIRSRLDQDLRSTTRMQLTSYVPMTGLSWEYLLPAWTQGTQQIGESDLILEGGDF